MAEMCWCEQSAECRSSAAQKSKMKKIILLSLLGVKFVYYDFYYRPIGDPSQTYNLYNNTPVCVRKRSKVTFTIKVQNCSQ